MDKGFVEPPLEINYVNSEPARVLNLVPPSMTDETMVNYICHPKTSHDKKVIISPLV